MLLVLAEAFFRGRHRDGARRASRSPARSPRRSPSIVMYRQLGAPATAGRCSAACWSPTGVGYMLTGAVRRDHRGHRADLAGPPARRTAGRTASTTGSCCCRRRAWSSSRRPANLVTVFLGIETMSIGVYVMTALRRPVAPRQRGRDEVLPDRRVRHRVPALRHRRWSTAPPARPALYAMQSALVHHRQPAAS